MPSHSKKQHNFMEAIAHSPSFAKKAGVPQSVGKEFAAADKGKTFKRGGDMKGYADGGMPMVNKGGKMVPSFAADGIGKMAKGGMAESKKMVGKEVAFMKKKGAPKSMIKHEEAEMMKRGGKVRKMAGGGMGDPFELSDEDRANYEKQGAKNLKNIKSFFGFDERESAPIDRSRDVERTTSIKPNAEATYRPRPPLNITKPNNQSPRTRRETEDTSYSDSIERDDAASMDKTAKGPQSTSSIATGGEYSGDGFPAFKPETSVTRTRKPVGFEKVEKKERVITEPVDTSYSALEARRATKKPKETKPESKSAGKFGMASDETRASVRKGLGSFLDFFDLSKAHEREFGKKMASGGAVKKVAEGGYTKADGVASRGKTQPKMVKMAKGGFVKSADGCAQRGKTKAFQVKMNRGGMC
jgi:hypothetical protein